METTTYNVTRLMDALAVWGGDFDDSKQEWAAADELMAAARELFSTIPGITGVYGKHGSAASIYFELTHEVAGEEESIKVRCSNHQKTSGFHVSSVWSFASGDSEKSVRLGLSKIEEALS